MKYEIKGRRLRRRVGEERIVSVFCWYPRRFDPHWYWLERINVIQRVRETHPRFDIGGHWYYKWKTVGIAEDES
jgi:hypothetical protein